MSFQHKWAVLIFGLAAARASSTPVCKSDSGEDVDFAYTFKYPDSWDYAYMDSHTDLAKSSKQLTSSSSSIGKLLEQTEGSDVSTFYWNDEYPPKKKTEGPHAHAKGFLSFSSEGGIWVTHSLPNFPSQNARSVSGMWDDASDDNGQSFLCITLTAEEIHKLSPVMEINWPTVYHAKWASGAKEKFPDIDDWTKERGVHDDKTMTTHVSIRSKGGQTFTFFGKSGDWGHKKDLYSDLVAPITGPLLMEGWRRGRGPWGPACGKGEVLDVLSVSFPGKDWSTMSDHSKWAVSQGRGTSFCVGDINRMDGQDGRGGGTVCIHDSSFASQMRKVVATTDKCSGEVVV